MISKKNIVLTTLALAGAALLVVTQSAWSNRHYQLGGGFIGNNGAGNIWSALQIPLDPNGKAAALRVNQMVYNAEFAGLLNACSADAVSEAVGELEMTGRDTAKYRTVGYVNQQGNPPTLRAILVMNGTLKFSGPDNFTVNYTIDVYAVNVPGVPTNSDLNADGFPDPGAVPMVSIPGVDHARRVPMP